MEALEEIPGLLLQMELAANRRELKPPTECLSGQATTNTRVGVVEHRELKSEKTGRLGRILAPALLGVCGLATLAWIAFLIWLILFHWL
jgi:hypothetical protein